MAGHGLDQPDLDRCDQVSATMCFDIREMTIDDYNEVLALWDACEGVGLHHEAEDSRDGIARVLDHNTGLSFVALDGGRIVGTIVGSQDGRRGYVRHLAVAPSHRRRGIGRALAERCTSVLRQAGIRRCNLHVMETNHDALAFWAKLGWTGRRDIIYMSGDTEPEAGPGGASR